MKNILVLSILLVSILTGCYTDNNDFPESNGPVNNSPQTKALGSLDTIIFRTEEDIVNFLNAVNYYKPVENSPYERAMPRIAIQTYKGYADLLAGKTFTATFTDEAAKSIGLTSGAYGCQSYQATWNIPTLGEFYLVDSPKCGFRTSNYSSPSAPYRGYWIANEDIDHPKAVTNLIYVLVNRGGNKINKWYPINPVNLEWQYVLN